MPGSFCRLVDDRTECKMAGGAAETPIKDVMGYGETAKPARSGKVVARKRRAGTGYPRGPREEWCREYTVTEWTGVQHFKP